MRMYKVIQGGCAKDFRGEIRFVNDLDLSMVKRFYIIKNADLDVVRGWRGHRIEKRWFFVVSGAIRFDIVRIDDWTSPNRDLHVSTVVLDANDQKVLFIPEGFATAFQSINNNSEVLVFSDYPIEHSSVDDYVFDVNYFLKRNSF